MLLSLTIKNFLLVKHAYINFNKNLSVITGETGAGKSLILRSLLFVLGNRVPKIITNKQENIIVIAEFDIKENEIVLSKLASLSIEAEDSLIVRRVIDKAGKIKNYLNDISVSVYVIKEISKYLIEIYSQHQQQSLMSSSYYLDIIDNFAKTESLKSALNNIYQNYISASADLIKTKEQLALIAKEKDYLDYTIEELKTLNVYIGEEEELINRRIILINKEKLTDLLVKTLTDLTKNNYVANIISIQKNLIRNNNFSSLNFDIIIDHLEKTIVEFEGATLELNNILDSINNEDDQLEQIEQRLFAIKSASKKYGIASDDFSSYLVDIKEKLLSLEDKEQIINNLFIHVQKLKSDYQMRAKELSNIRNEHANLLEKEIIAELIQLKMPHIIFQIIIESNQEEVKQNGIDKISFMISLNPGMPLADLAKILSGGELSRFMLGVCVVLSNINNNRNTLLFDEIDAGLSGLVSDAVGSRLLLISENTQVIAITHQAQVASKGNIHIKVLKDQHEEETITKVILLNQEERINEIATMISGEKVTKEANEAAKKLLNII